MRKVGLTFGVIAGLLLSVFLLFGHLVLWEKGIINFDTGEIWGYTTMVVAMSAVFFGIKSYRDKHLKGTIGFWTGFRLGLLIYLVAAVMYATTWEAYSAAQPEEVAQFFSEYQKREIDKDKADGATPEELDAKVQQYADFMEWYKIPILRFGVSMAELLPVGLLASLVSAALLRRRDIAPQ